MEEMPIEHKTKKLALIAGNGQLPHELYQSLAADGNPPMVLGLRDEVGEWARDKAKAMLAWGEIGKMFKLLEEGEIKQVLLAGGVAQRPDFLKLKLDWGAVKTLPKILSFMIGGDNQVLDGVVSIFNKKGLEIVGIHDVAPHLLANEGLICGKAPNKKQENSIDLGFSIAQAIGQHDIGQGLVMVGKRAVAVEGAEGTDAMILRIGALKSNGRLASEAGGILIKCARPTQDLRVDLPSIGPHTIENAAKSGLNGLAIEANKTLILEKEKTLALAKSHKIFILAKSIKD